MSCIYIIIDFDVFKLITLVIICNPCVYMWVLVHF